MKGLLNEIAIDLSRIEEREVERGVDGGIAEEISYLSDKLFEAIGIIEGGEDDEEDV